MTLASTATGRSTAGFPLALPAGDLWVFGYGSLMWAPGFACEETRAAHLYGYHRALCVWSWVYRGTRARPGLVLGLDTGGSSVGRAFRVAQRDKHAVARDLCERELVTNVYVPVLKSVRLDNDAWACALVFKVDRAHAQYAGKLSAEQAASTVRQARGRGGANMDYIARTVAHLDALGIADSTLHRVQALLSAVD